MPGSCFRVYFVANVLECSCLRELPLLLQQRCPGRSLGHHPVGHLQPAPADGLCGRGGDRHALWEEVSRAGKGLSLAAVAAPPRCQGWASPQMGSELGGEGVISPTVKMGLKVTVVLSEQIDV